MSQRKPYKHHKKGNGERFVALPYWLLNSRAWQSCTPKARALYLEIKMNFNGTNNGKIFLSHRLAANRLNVSRPTIASAFKELIAKGFIIETCGAFLGGEGIGQSAHYALTEFELNGCKPTKDFMR